MDILLLLLTVALPMVLGYITRRSKLFDETESNTLGKFVIRVSVPFLIFKSLFKADIKSLGQVFPSAAAIFLLTVLYTVGGYYLARYLADEKRVQNAVAFSVFAGNYIFLGWGVLDSFYGEPGLTRGVFFTLLAWPVFLLCGFWLCHLRNRMSSTTGARHSFWRVLLKNALLPFVAAIMGIGFNLIKVPLPEVAWDFISKFAGITIPMILFTIGLNVKIRMPGSHIKIVLAASLYRLVFGGLLGILTVLVIGLIFPMDPLTQKVILLEAIMPAAAMTVFFTQYADIHQELQAAVITISTILSLVTIPLWYLAIEAFI